MLNAQAALGFVERIEAVRAAADEGERAILAELRSAPDYEANSDKDLFEAIRLRAAVREALADADTLISAFDWVYDEEYGENRRKGQQP